MQIVGEPGIGKSRLIADLLERAPSRGFLAVGGRASELERDVPFAVWQDALTLVLPQAAERLKHRLASEYQCELSAVFPSLAGEGEQGVALALPGERYQLHRAFAALLEALAAKQPLVLALDDLHWADAASVEAVLHMVERPPAAPVLLALAYRPRQLDPDLANHLESAAQRGVERIELAPLAWSAAAQLVPRELPSDLRRQLYRNSGGNPFYLEQLVRAARQDEARVGVALRRRGDARVPMAVAAAISRELAALSATGRRVLEGAAVAGDSFTPEIAAAAAQVPVDQTLEVMDELVEHDVVRPMHAAGRFRFRHPIIYQVVYGGAPPGWRITAHARVASHLAERGAPATARAPHVERFAGPGDRVAIAVLKEAATIATTRAPATAARWFQAALALLEPGSPDAQDLLAGAAVTLAFAGQLLEARDAFQDLLVMLEPGVSPERTMITRFAAMVEYLLGHLDQGRQLILDLLEQVPDDSAEACELRVELAYGGFIAADWPAVREWARAALAGPFPEPNLHAAALSLHALGDYGLGDTEGAKARAGEARQLVDGLADQQLMTRLEAISVLAWAEFCLEDLERSVTHATRGIQISQAFQQGHLIVAMEVVQALGLLAQGMFARASSIAQDAIESSRLSATKLFECWALTTRCDAELQAGDARQAVNVGEQAREAARESRSPWGSVADPYLAEAYLEAGHPDRCLATMLDAHGNPRLPPFPYYAPRCHETLMRAYLRQGDVDAAGAQSLAAAAAAERIGLPGARAVGARAQAEIALVREDTEEALLTAREAVAFAEAAALPVEAARCRVVVGRALAAGGQRAAAAGELGRAHRELANHGAQRYRDRAASELRRLGTLAARNEVAGDANGPPPRSPSAVGAQWRALSEREREVATLVARGHTNKEIASKLGLAEKTIASHLARIFKRLGLTSRAELAAIAERARHT